VSHPSTDDAQAALDRRVTAALSDNQIARAAALTTAREVLLSKSGFASTAAPDAMDVYNLATYIVTGEDPWEVTPEDAFANLVSGVVRRVVKQEEQDEVVRRLSTVMYGSDSTKDKENTAKRIAKWEKAGLKVVLADE